MNMTSCRTLRIRCSAFSLVEALLTIGIMSILTGLVITAVSNASRDASRMVARQQQNAVQSAVSAWVTSQLRDENPTSQTRGQIRSLESIRTIYNAYATSLARLNVISKYLDDATASHLISSTTNSDKIKSDALFNARQYLSLGTWTTGGYPKVELSSE